MTSMNHRARDDDNTDNETAAVAAAPTTLVNLVWSMVLLAITCAWILPIRLMLHTLPPLSNRRSCSKIIRDDRASSKDPIRRSRNPWMVEMILQAVLMLVVYVFSNLGPNKHTSQASPELTSSKPLHSNVYTTRPSFCGAPTRRGLNSPAAMKRASRDPVEYRPVAVQESSPEPARPIIEEPEEDSARSFRQPLRGTRSCSSRFQYGTFPHRRHPSFSARHSSEHLIWISESELITERAALLRRHSHRRSYYEQKVF